MRLQSPFWCLLVAVVLSLSGCHYSEENAWSDCCLLYIVRDQSAAPAGRTTIIDWPGQTPFGPRGSAQNFVEDTPPESLLLKKIKADLAEFLAGNRGSGAVDYFVGLGMSCMPLSKEAKGAAARCEIELPIWIECHTRSNSFVPWAIPVPKELQRPISAFLRMNVEVSADTVLDASTRIDPTPGGHLCHR